jgi:hypothetical protein
MASPPSAAPGDVVQRCGRPTTNDTPCKLPVDEAGQHCRAYHSDVLDVLDVLDVSGAPKTFEAPKTSKTCAALAWGSGVYCPCRARAAPGSDLCSTHVAWPPPEFARAGRAAHRCAGVDARGCRALVEQQGDVCPAHAHVRKARATNNAPPQRPRPSRA